MSTKYVCGECRKKLGLSGLSVANEDGGKRCYQCDVRSDDLESVTDRVFYEAANKLNGQGGPGNFKIKYLYLTRK